MDTDRLGIVIAATCLIIIFFAVPMSGFTNHGTRVVPATDADPPAPNTDTSGADATVTFWELPPRVILEAVVFSISPLLVYPLELFFFVKMFAYLGYRKITTASVLNAPTRRKIYEAVAASPGIYFNELARQTGIARSTLRYHLALLKMTGKITISKTGSSVRYFENSGKFSGTEQKILASLHNDRERFICEYLLQNPATTRGDLEKVLGISGAAVTWHTNRLREAGVLSITRNGRTVQYTIAPDALPALGRLSQGRAPGSNADVPE